MFVSKELLVDKENKRYKKYFQFLFFKIGDWEPLLPVSYVALTRVDGAQTFNSARTMGSSSTAKFDLFCVYLCADAKRKVLGFKSKDSKEALFLANNVANYLDVEVRNFIK